MSKIIVFALGLLTLVLAACTPAAEARPEEALAAQEWLAERLGAEIGTVSIVSSEKVEFSDSCLGLGGPAESCLAEPVPGWLIVLEVGGESYEVHTDEGASQIRLKE